MVVAGAFALLALADLAGLSWPLSWHTHDDACYNEMFCEPARKGWLIGHLGNTMSNWVYLYAGICILISAPSSVFWAADIVFGVNLILLTICSVIWHSSNAPKSHYVDLWSMDSCIVYLILRNLAVAILWLVKPHIWVASSVCLILYLMAIHFIMIARCGPALAYCYGKGPLDLHCEWSGRQRLMAGDLDMTGACLFWGMPAVYMIIPALVQIFVIKSSGSVVAASIAGLSLGVGWSYRMLERFCMDGCGPMNWACNLPSTLLRTVVAALVSPTAQMHMLTGVTLLFGYAWVRSMDHEVLAAL